MAQNPITVYYDNKDVGEFVADGIVEDVIILELKSVRRIVKAHALHEFWTFKSQLSAHESCSRQPTTNSKLITFNED